MPLFIKLFVDDFFNVDHLNYITSTEFDDKAPQKKVLTYEGFCFELASLMQPKWVIETVECSTEASMKKIKSSSRYNHELTQLMVTFQTLPLGDAATGDV